MKMKNGMETWLRGVLTGALAVGIWSGGVAGPRSAHACGGLFCNSAMPVNQAAERIIFSIDKPNKKVTAVVEILYQGPSEKFAWVLPVPGIPKVEVSNSAMLDRLQSLTNPSYSIQRDWKGAGCNSQPPSSPGSGSSSGGSSGSADPGVGGGGVTVVASGAVGPYVYEVIKVDPLLPDPGMTAVNWLKGNGYDVGALGNDILRAYLRDGLNLLAFKLAKNKSAGAIRPVMLTYDSDHPMIPIRPTAVAANSDMGVLVFVLGASRAVPTNYKTLELNEAALDWFMPAATYNAVVTAAADEAQGQGFVTELASANAMSGIASSIYPEAFAVQDFRQTADSLNPSDLIVKMIETFVSFSSGGIAGPAGGPFGGSSGRVALDGVADVLTTALTLPAGVKADDVLASPRCYLAAFRTPGMFYCNGRPAPTEQQVIDLTGFDKVKFLSAVEALVIKPMESTAELFVKQPYLTRLYTTLSPDEMTLDPEFDLNSEIGDVANLHQITLTYTKGCFGDTSGPWEAIINGFKVLGTGNTWPVKGAATKMPFNLRVLQLGVTGMGTVTTNNTATIAAALGSPVPPAGGAGGASADGGGTNTGAGGNTPGVDGGGPATVTDSGCGCRLGGANDGSGGSGGIFASLLGLGLVLERRRRRRTPV
jgi:hypothetical protein